MEGGDTRPNETEMKPIENQEDTTNTTDSGTASRPAPHVASGNVSTHKDFTESMDTSPCVVVAKSTCGFCSRAISLLQTTGVRVDVFYIDMIAEGDKVRKAAKEEASGHSTVPIIFIKGEFVGGCNDVVDLEASGELYTKLGVSAPPKVAAWVTGKEVRKKPMDSGMFYFPHTVNAYVIRLVALQMVALCIVCIIFRDEEWAAYVALGMALDFLVRLIGGAAFSPAGALALLVSTPLKEDLRNGPPKQFATMIGLVFSLVGGLLLYFDCEIAGAVVLGCLSGPAALEGVFDFCLGCWFFGYMVKLGIVSDSVYHVHIDQKPAVQRTLDLIDDFETELKKVVPLQYREPGQPKTAADVNLKRYKSDDHVRRGFNPVKNVHISDMMMPLGVAGLALVWKKNHCFACDSDNSGAYDSYMGPKEIWHVFAFVSLVLFACIALLLVAKLVRHRKKVYAELVHPIKSNAVAALPMCICVYSILLSPGSRDFAQALFWIGAVPLKFLLVWKCSWLVGNRGDAELTTPSLLLPIGGCLVASMNASIWAGYAELAWFLFSLPCVLSLLLFGGTFLSSISYHWSDERMRASIGMWSTVLHLICISYAALQKLPMYDQLTGRLSGYQSSYMYMYMYGRSSTLPSSTNMTVEMNSFSKAMYFAGVMLVLIFLWLAVPMGFIFRVKFDFTYWSVAFTADIFAAAASIYAEGSYKSYLHARSLDHYARAIATGALLCATWVNVVLLLNTAFWIVKKRWLRPQYKFGPLSFNKLTHEALRESGHHLLRSAEGIVAAGTENTDAVKDLSKGLVAHLKLHLMVLDWHSHMEDTILFRMVDSFHPMVSRDGYAQHAALHKMEASAKAILTKLEDPSSDHARDILELRDLLQQMVPFSDQHMDWEEDNLNGLLRKGFNMAIQRKLLVNIWDSYMSKTMEEIRGTVTQTDTAWSHYDFTKLSAEASYYSVEKDFRELLKFPPQFPVEEIPMEKQQILRVALPFIVHWLPLPIQRTRFMRTLAWGVPEHAQQVGDMVYRGVPDTTWAVLAVDVPEMIPRGLPGWVRRV